MSEKAWKRLKIFLIVLGILIFTGYFAFRTFVFDPLEGAFGQIPAAIPRTVDFYLRKKNLRNDFSNFPEPHFYEAMSQSDSWRRFLRSEIYQSFNRTQHIEAKLEEFKNNLATLPIDLMGDLLGKEVVIVGRKPEGSKDITDFALFTRVSWKIKLGLGLIRYDTLRSRFAPNLSVQVDDDDILRIKGAAPQDIYLWRDHDLLVVGTDPWFLRRAQQLLSTRGEDSLGLSAKYFDEVQHYSVEENSNELEFYVDVEDLVKTRFGAGNWPIVQWDLAGRIIAEFIKPEAFQETLGILRFGESLWLRSHFSLNGDMLSDFQRRLYDTPPLNLSQEVLEKAKMVPPRSFVFAAMACDVGEFFRAFERAFDDNQRRLINDQFKAVGPYRDMKQFIDDFAPAFRRNVFLMCQKNDYPKMKDDPPNDGMPDPVWALVLPVKNHDKLADLVKYFVNNSKAFGVENTFYFDVRGGYKATEFFSQLIPGTGEIAVLPAGDTFYISNSPKYLREILQYRFATNASWITTEPGFEEALKAVDPSANVFCYFNSRRYQPVYNEQIPYIAQRAFRIDYQSERLKATDRILREKYPGQRRPLPAEIEKQVEKLVDQEINNLDLTLRGPGIEKLRKELEDYGVWMSSFPYMLMTLRTGHKQIDLTTQFPVDWK